MEEGTMLVTMVTLYFARLDLEEGEVKMLDLGLG